MRNRLEWTAAIVALVLIFGAAASRAVAVTAEAVREQKSMHTTIAESMKTDYTWARINAYDVNLREGPGLWFTIVGSLDRGVAVEVMREVDGWYEILHWSCKEPVWVYGEYVTFGGF